MSIDCIVVTTNIANRLPLLENAIQSIEKSADKDLFSKKILSVDIFQGGKSFDYFEKFSNLGWNVVSQTSNSLFSNQRNAIKHTSSDYIFYSEDDIVINKIPSKKTIDSIINKNTSCKQMGFICYNTHTYEQYMHEKKYKFHNLNKISRRRGKTVGVHNEEREIYNRLLEINNINNFLKIDDELFFIKPNSLIDNFFLNFPVAIVKRDIFLKLHEKALDSKYSSYGIETAFTKVWIDLLLHEKFSTAIYVKNNTISNMPLTLTDMIFAANMNFWNNDETLRHRSILDNSQKIIG